jgi:hypothetical protein
LVDQVQPPIDSITFKLRLAFFNLNSCFTQPYALLPTSFQAVVDVSISAELKNRRTNGVGLSYNRRHSASDNRRRHLQRRYR